MKNYRYYALLGCLIFAVALLPLFILGCASEADKSFEEAKALYTQGNYDGAIAKYKEVLEGSTKASVKERALYLIGWTYYSKLENYEQALSTFQELIDKFPANPYLEEVMFRSAYCLGQVGKDDEALKQYEALVNRFPESQSEYFTLAYFNQGATYNRQQNYEAALENYELSLKSTQDLNRQAEIQLRIGRIYHRQENYQNAITTFEKAITISESAIAIFELESKEDSKSDELTEAKLNLANAKVGIADIYFDLERWEGAIDEYESVFNEYRSILDEHSEKYVLSKSSYRIGKAYYKLSTKPTETGRKNETPESLDNLDIQAIRAERENAERENPDNFNQALDWYEKTLKDFPDSYDWAINRDLGEILEVSYREQNYDHAELALQKLSDDLYKGNPTISMLDVDLYLIGADLIGSENRSQQNYKGALRAFTALVDVFPESKFVPLATYYIGETNYHLKEYRTSRKFLEKFLTLSSFGSYFKGEARRLIAESYLDQKYHNQAYLSFDKLTTAEFKNNTELQAEAMYKAAYCLKEIKVNDEALGRYAEFMTRFPNSKYITDAYFDLGDFYVYNKKDYELARFNYNRALQSPESPKHSKAEIQLQIGHTYYNQGNLEKASNVYNVLLQEYPESEQVLMARRQVAHIHRRENRGDEAIRAYESIIANHAEGKPVYFIYNIDYGFPLRVNLIAESYVEIGVAFFNKKDFERAFNSYARIVRKPAGDEKDLRKDPFAPFALYEGMVVLCKLGRKDELETFATTYINSLGDINDLSNDELILCAEAQLKFADVLREELKDYNKASAEYAKLQDYPPIQHPRLELVKLRGKYYEGQCYENGTTHDKLIETYQEVIRLFESIFRPLVDNPNIDVSNVPKDQFDYCLSTARYYAGNSYFATEQFEKAIIEFEEFLKIAAPESEKAKTAQDKIEKARRNLGAKAERPKNSSKNLTPEQKLAQRAGKSTVLLTMEYVDPEEAGTGTGFFVHSDLIATNYHVIEGAISGTARLVGGTKMSYAVVGYTAVDPGRDLAILKVRAFGVKPLPLGNSDEVNQGDAVYPIGNPLGLVNVVSDGQISSIQWVDSIREFLKNRSRLVSDVQRNDTPNKLFMMTAPTSFGNSGGPVLSNESEVVGISVAGFTVGQNLNFAVPVNYLKALLDRTGPPKSLSNLEIIN